MNILVEMKHGLGDCVMFLPAVKALRDKYPDASITLLINSNSNLEIFKHSGIRIDNYFYFSIKERGLWTFIKLLYALFKVKFDIALVAPQTPRLKARVFLSLLRIKKKIGYQFMPKKLLDNKPIHYVAQGVNLVEPIVGKVDSHPHLYADEELIKKFSSYFDNSKPIVLVNVGAGAPNYYKGKYVYTKRWGELNFVNVVDAISKWDINVVLLGGRFEIDEEKKYENLLKRSNIYNFIGKTNLLESLALLTIADISIGIDTGMQHVAAALGTKTISIFGPTSPRISIPFSDNAVVIESQNKCRFCFENDLLKYYTCDNRVCLKSITVERVVAVIKSELNSNK